MNRKELLLLAAASIFATDPLQSYSLAVMKASVLLDEVLKHEQQSLPLSKCKAKEKQ